MRYTIEKNIGIDSVIESVSSELYDELGVQFPNAEIDGFGRIYRNRKREVGLVPEFRIGKEYRDVYLDDRKDGLYAFITSERSETDDEFIFSNEVKIIFFLNLDTFYSQYLDEQAHRDIISILRKISYRRFTVTGVETGIENVFSGFETEGIKFSDLAPYHLFSIGATMYFNLNDSCNG